MRSPVLLAALVAAALATLAGGVRAAHAKQVRFVGVHPIATEMGGGFCYIELTHVHVYEPVKAEVLFRVHDDAYHFVGDPVPYGYDGPKHAYVGPHPVAVDVVLAEDDLDGDEVEYCYLEGPHYHYFVPAPSSRFSVKGGVYWYVGDLPPAYGRDRPRYGRINGVYKPLVYARPVVVAAPPPEYHGPFVDVEVVGPRAQVVVPAPHAGARVEAGVGFSAGVEVHVPAPVLEVRVGVPGVVVEEHHHHDVVIVDHDRGKRKVKHKGKGHGKWDD